MKQKTELEHLIGEWQLQNSVELSLEAFTSLRALLDDAYNIGKKETRSIVLDWLANRGTKRQDGWHTKYLEWRKTQPDD